MPELAVTFRCAEDELIGILHSPDSAVSNIGVLIVVGGPQYRVGSHRQFTLMARGLAEAGYTTFRFDYRGMGDSTGAPRTFKDVEQDIRAGVDAFLGAAPTLTGIAIFGLCDAASAALMYGPTDVRVLGLILANPWVRTEAGHANTVIRHYYRGRLLQRSFWGKLLKGELHVLTAVADLIANWRKASARSSQTQDKSAGNGFIDRMRIGVERFHGPILVLISSKDLTAREFSDLCVNNLAWAEAMRRQNIARAALTGADHTFSARPSLHEAVAVCLAWLDAFPEARRSVSGKN